MSYVNFDVELQSFSDTDYRVRVSAPESFKGRKHEFVFNPQEIDDLCYKIEQLSTENQSALSERLRTQGTILYADLFGGEVGNALAAYRATNPQIRIRLSLADTPELWRVPWEMLWPPDTDQPLACSLQTALVRISDTQVLPVLPLSNGPIRLLVVASSVGGDKFDEQKEIDNLIAAVQPLIHSGRLVVEHLRSPTFAKFVEVWTEAALNNIPFHMLHMIGHGTYKDGKGYLVFADEAGDAAPIESPEIASQLRDCPPCFVLLNLCKGATNRDGESFAGVAQNLIRHGATAVIGMQFSISLKAAEIFSSWFYKTLALGTSLEKAVARGRAGLRANQNLIEWITPVLFLQKEGFQLLPEEGRAMEAATIESTRATPPVMNLLPAVDTPQKEPIIMTPAQILEIVNLALKCPTVGRSVGAVRQQLPEDWRNSIVDGANTFEQVLNMCDAAEANDDWASLDQAIALFDGSTVPYKKFKQKLQELGLVS